MVAGEIPSFPGLEWEGGKGAAMSCDRDDLACRGRTAFQATAKVAALSGAKFASESVGVPARMPPQFSAASANNTTSGPSAERTKTFKRPELAIGRSIQPYVAIEAQYDKALLKVLASSAFDSRNWSEAGGMLRASDPQRRRLNGAAPQPRASNVSQ